MTKKIITTFFLSLILIFLLSLVFSGKIILPQNFSLGSITIHYYGLFMALAVASGFYLAIKRANRFGLTANQAEDILFWIVVGGFIGARLYHVLSSLQFYLNHPVDIFKIWNGGLSIYGVVLGGIISLFVYRKLTTYNLQLTTILNWLTPSLIVGQIIGRFGNMFNYELYGYPTILPWKMFVPTEFRQELYLKSEYFHPLFLYEQIGLITIFFLLKRSENYKNPLLFFWYVLLYNILRIPLEFLRIDSVFIGGVRQNASVSFVLILVSIFFIVKYARRKERVFS